MNKGGGKGYKRSLHKSILGSLNSKGSQREGAPDPDAQEIRHSSWTVYRCGEIVQFRLSLEVCFYSPNLSIINSFHCHITIHNNNNKKK